jgi:hypothetical protein
MFTATLTLALGDSECEKGRILHPNRSRMKVDIYRKVETGESITGEFWIDGVRQCYYLEPSRLTPFYPGHPCIPAGTYRVVLTMSPHLGYVCPEVLNVPGRTAIRWHIGNFPKDVLGCCVMGTELGQNFVGNSRAAFNALMAKLTGARHRCRVSRSGSAGDRNHGIPGAIWRRIGNTRTFMTDPTTPAPPSPAQPSQKPQAEPAAKGPTINIGEEFGTAKKNLPPVKIVLIAVGAVLVAVLIASFVKRAQPQGNGSLDNIAAEQIPGQDSTMAALTFTLRNTSNKVLYVHSLQGEIKTASGEQTADAVSAIDFDRYYQYFPSLKVGAQPALMPEAKIQPGQSVAGTIMVAFPVKLDDFNKRQSTSVVIWPYDQQLPIVLTR